MDEQLFVALGDGRLICHRSAPGFVEEQRNVAIDGSGELRRTS